MAHMSCGESIEKIEPGFPNLIMAGYVYIYIYKAHMHYPPFANYWRLGL